MPRRPFSMSSGLVAAQYPSQAMSLPQAFQPPSQAPAPHMPQFMTDAGAERNVRAAQNAVLQAVEVRPSFLSGLRAPSL